MKKFALGIAAAALMMSSSTAWAQASDSESIAVESSVSEECNVNATSTGINITYEFDQIAANVIIECNLYGNVDVQFSSPNDGIFQLLGPNSNIDFSIDVIPQTADAEGFLGFTSLDNVGPMTFVVDNTGGLFIDPFEFELRINVDPAQNAGQLFAGDYTDEVRVDVRPS